MLRIMLIIGTRPNMMKASALIHAMRDRFVVHLVHTGQHYDANMSRIFFEELGLPEPDHYLGVGNQSPLQQIGHIILALEAHVQAWQPQLIIVVGDVNSTLAAAIVANKLSIPLAHVEAGLRSRNRAMPEEHNRIVTDHLADYLFTPSPDGNQNLSAEGIPENRIHFVGNVMVDTLYRFRERAIARAPWERYGTVAGEYALATIHRPANVDTPAALSNIIHFAVGCRTMPTPLSYPSTHKGAG
jgi:UDP-N-acetylglucosamine 2-epimerase (non-hydrolysing)